MTGQPSRLAPDAPHGFGGREIDRSSPLRFRLNGRTFEAFEGDTVLSALLAGGVDTLGTLAGHALALDESCAPPVAPRRARGAAHGALPMDRTPALPGLDLVTTGPRTARARWAPWRFRFGRGSDLGLLLDTVGTLVDPWEDLSRAETLAADIAVVGGGIAGMSAALRAADAGQRVVLVEREPTLGGIARFFGRVGDEEPPDDRIARLNAQVASRDTVEVLVRAEAVNLSGTRLLVHQVQVIDGTPVPRLVRVAASHVVLATGMSERLPVFPGNRVPGVVGALQAFSRADRYGVWGGRSALVATSQNTAYRVALLAADAGIGVRRVVDARPAPRSRFIDFAKATGITLASGLLVRSVERQRGQLSVAFAVAIEGATGEAETIATDVLVASGGWQPRLGLWLMAGGAAAYDAGRSALFARDTLFDVRMAGSAAGLGGSSACEAAGAVAVDALLGRNTAPIEEALVETIYESPPAPTSHAAWRPGRLPAFLDSGTSFTLRRPGNGKDRFAARQFRPLSVADIAAAVETGAIPAEAAGIVAGERCLGGNARLPHSSWRLPQDEAMTEAPVPGFLHGRFGPRPLVASLVATDGRRLEAGCLAYASSELADPLDAVGVVITASDAAAHAGAPAARALLDRQKLANRPPLFVRDSSGAVPVEMVSGNGRG